MNYAMIPINRRYNDKSERVVRRVLISYKHKNLKGEYKGSKLVDHDPYFDDPKSSQQYVFTDKYFYLTDNAYGNSTLADELQNSLIGKKRKYQFDAGYLIETAIEFQAETEKEAIEKFHTRSELH